MTKDEIIKALRDMARYPTVTLPRDCEALRAAADLLAQPAPVQEPVAWEQFYPDIGKPQIAFNSEVVGYVAPQRTWVGLTDEEIQELRYKIDSTAHWTYDEFARAIEAKLRSKNENL